MIIALDIETVANGDALEFMPEPTIDSRLKDPVKIAAAENAAKQKQIDAMALDAMTARICCFAAVGVELSETWCAEVKNDEEERGIIQRLLKILGSPAMRIATWNGAGFDLPMIYKRAMILGINPGTFDAPPLTAWTKRYNTDQHIDLMQIWSGWSPNKWAKLEDVARMVMHEEREDIDYKLMPELLKTEEGRKKIEEGCLNHTRLTWDLFNRFNGFLFV